MTPSPADGPVVTRFAPSPTGYLHIGGARTALFNWLYAAGHGGRMLLRIEDTDRERSTREAVDAILDGLTWLGLDWDGEPVSQAARADRHREVAQQLVAQGDAYYCYATPEELAQMREQARAAGKPPRYDGRWRDRDPSQAPPGVPGAIRIKAPTTGETVVDDQVQGRITFPNKDLDDMVIARSDGSATYMLAVVVDDHDMGVTHIIRGDDHLTNAARQTLIYNAMGWPVPVMAHVPLIHGSDGAKLSKRHGALGVDAYRAMGYLPDALRNYLVRLGWAHGDEEIISRDDMVRWFDLDAIGKAPARFDFTKLENLNGHYIRDTQDGTLTETLLATAPHLEGADHLIDLNDDQRRLLLTAMSGLKARAKTLIELANSARFLFAERPLRPDNKAAAILADGGDAMLGELLPTLEGLASWSAESVENSIREYAEAAGTKLGKIAQPLRCALTGTTTSPGVFDVMAVLGRQESLARLSDRLR